MYHARLFDIIVYRITYTNVDGKVFEFCRQLLPNISNIRAIPDVDMELPNDVIEPEVEAVQR